MLAGYLHDGRLLSSFDSVLAGPQSFNQMTWDRIQLQPTNQAIMPSFSAERDFVPQFGIYRKSSESAGCSQREGRLSSGSISGEMEQ